MPSTDTSVPRPTEPLKLLGWLALILIVTSGSVPVQAQPLDCFGVPGGWAIPFGVCDDGDPNTTGDMFNEFCLCVGDPPLPIPDCLDIPGGSALPGTPCDDDDPDTDNDFWSANCECVGGWNVISGRVFLDADENGIYDGTDLLIQNRTVQLGPEHLFGTTDSAGEFIFAVLEGAFSLFAYGGPHDQQATPPSLFTLTGTGTASSDNDLAMVGDADANDLMVTMVTTPLLQIFWNKVTITIKNIGNMTSSGVLSFTFDPLQELEWVDADAAVQGNTITWPLEPMELGEIVTREVYLTSESTPVGTPILYTATIVSDIPDVDADNDTYSLENFVLAPFDPNDKLVQPAALTPAEVTDGKYINYTIRFQNTGTYYAQDVRIEDQLSNDLDVTSFEFLGSSHACEWTIHNGLLVFEFNNIMLPDSGMDQLGSNGHVQFRIKPKPSLQLGDVVENSASIYFDLNEPIVTAPAVLTIDEFMQVRPNNIGEVHMWPNPATDLVWISTPRLVKDGRVSITDLNGRSLWEKGWTAGPNEAVAIPMDGIADGVYMLRLVDQMRTFVRPLLKSRTR